MTKSKNIITACAAMTLTSEFLAAPANAITSIHMRQHEMMTTMAKSKTMHHMQMVTHNKEMMQYNM